MRFAWVVGLSALVACGPGDDKPPVVVCTGNSCVNTPICPTERVCGTACCEPTDTCSNEQCVPATDGEQCIYIPGPGEFEAPVRVWWWPWIDGEGTARQDIELPEFDQVMSTPTVVRLRPTDPSPSVVFGTFRSGGAPVLEGVLRIVNGADGQTVLSVTDPELRINGVSSPAVGDLDGDGEVEIVTGAYDASHGDVDHGLIAFRADGTLLWRRPGIFVGWGGPAIAELDGVPPAEVVIGNWVLDGATGKIRCWGGWPGKGDNGVGPLSAVVDIDADGKPEIVTGNMAYRLEKDDAGNDVCTRLWPGIMRLKNGDRLWDGFVAVADIYDDPAIRTTVGFPEIAVVSDGHVRVHDWTGGILMNPVPLPGGGKGGPPTIADFDGDGLAEIGVAALQSYTVFKPGRPGNRLWTVPTQDASSSTTGSSVFDFDGNGRAEVVYADECYVHVYDGATGMEIFQAPNTSCTAYEMPVIADVDGDGAAELLVGANDECSITCPYGTHRQAQLTGLQAFKSPSDAWVASRPVWNQHTYHVTNVDDDGGIPYPESRSWGPETRNSFRQNYQGIGVFDAPNLRVHRARLDGRQCPVSLVLVAEIENIGARAVRAGMPVAFYEETGAGRTLLGTSELPVMLRPGQRAEVSLDWVGPPRINAASVVVVADDDGTGLLPAGRHKECDETNNEASLEEVVCREAG